LFENATSFSNKIQLKSMKLGVRLFGVFRAVSPPGGNIGNTGNDEAATPILDGDAKKSKKDNEEGDEDNPEKKEAEKKEAEKKEAEKKEAEKKEAEKKAGGLKVPGFMQGLICGSADKKKGEETKEGEEPAKEGGRTKRRSWCSFKRGTRRCGVRKRSWRKRRWAYYSPLE